jgi:hypothetical protein
MTRFNKTSLRKSGQYLVYNDSQTIQKDRFVARFKHKGPVTMSLFKRELIRSHSVESYFTKLEVEQKAPLVILKEHNPSWYNRIMSEWKCKHKFTF